MEKQIDLCNKSNYSNQLDEFVIALSKEINKIDEQISIIRFGSSIYGEVHDNMDIDILLLSEKDYFVGDYEFELRQLKDDLLEGKNKSNLKIVVPEIEKKVDVFVEQYSNSVFKFIPKFIFGPIAYDFEDVEKIRVYLHFKGPITKHQLTLFCKYFSFHSKPIIHHTKIIKGTFNVKYFDSFITLKKEDLDELCYSLEKRIIKSTSVLDVKKCIKKLLMNYSTFEGHNLNNQEVLFNHYKTILKIDIDYLTNTNDLNGLKEEFHRIYNTLNPIH